MGTGGIHLFDCHGEDGVSNQQINNGRTGYKQQSRAVRAASSQQKPPNKCGTQSGMTDARGRESWSGGIATNGETRKPKQTTLPAREPENRSKTPSPTGFGNNELMCQTILFASKMIHAF